MNAIKLRDELFSELHAEVLKPRGYKKSGHWSTKHLDGFVFSVYLRANRWSSQEVADFWLDLHVFHEGWHRLFTGETLLPKLKESIPSVIYEQLGEREGPEYRTLTINNETNVSNLKTVLLRRLLEYVVSLEDQCNTLEGVLAFLEASPSWPNTASNAAGIALLLEQEERARHYMQLAMDNALHVNRLQWLEKEGERLWSNWSKFK